MKKLLVLFLGLSLFLAACGGETEETSEASADTESTEESSAETEETAQEDEDSEPEEETAEDENVVESEVGTLEIASQNKGLDDTHESGPINITITDTQIGTLKPSESYVEMFDGKEELTVVTVAMNVENTSEDNVGIYPDQATLTTDAGDQVETDMLLSDSVGGDFYGQVNKDGNVIFTLDTPAEEISSGKLIIDGTHDENFETIGDPLEIEIEF